MAEIEFQVHVERHFGFLVTEKGYQCLKPGPNRVRFESTTTFIEFIYDGNRSYELQLLVGMRGLEANGNSLFSIDEILRLRRAPDANKFSLVQITSSEAMASFIQQLADVLLTYGADFIAGGDRGFIELAEQRRRESEAYALERNLRKARADADTAWHKKDYLAVVRAFKPLRAALTATEVGKLEFAETQSRQHTH